MKNLLSILTLLIYLNVQAQTTYTATNGPGAQAWEFSSTWEGGVSPGFTINAADTVIIPAGLFTSLSNNIVNNGTIIIEGIFYISSISLTITNNGSIQIANGGQIYHNANNITTTETIINNFGLFTNSGTIACHANLISPHLIYNAFGATFTNTLTGTIDLRALNCEIENHGSFDNYGTIGNIRQLTNYDALQNFGSLEIKAPYNGETYIAYTDGISRLYNEPGAVISNSGDIYLTCNVPSLTAEGKNEGTIQTQSGSTFRLWGTYASVFDNEGIFNNSGELQIPQSFNSTRTFNHNSGTFTNSGTIVNSNFFNNSSHLVNNGNINNTIEGALTNYATITNNIGSISNATTFNNTKDAIINNNSTATITNSNILNNIGRINNFANATLTNSSNFNTIYDSSAPTNSGQLYNNGIVTNTNNMNLYFIENNGNNAVFTNEGTLTLNSNGNFINNAESEFNNDNIFNTSSSSFVTINGTNSIFNNSATATISGQLTSNNNSTINNLTSGNLNFIGTTNLYALLTNNGEVTNSPNGSVILRPNGEFRNEGSSTFTNNANLSLIGGTLTNTSTVLNTNNISFAPDTTLPSLSNTGNGIITNQGTINFASGSFVNDAEFINTNTLIVNNNTLNNTQNGIFKNNNSGVLDIINNGVFLVSFGDFENNNSATINIDAASVFENDLGLIENNSTITNLGILAIYSGTLTNSTTGKITNNNNFTNVAGILNNEGVFEGSNTSHSGNFINDGILSPGNSPGTYTLNASYTHQVSANLIAEIESNTSYDILNLTSGNASINGDLTINLINGFTPSIGDSYTILTANFVSGTFQNINYPNLPSDREWLISYNSNSIVLNIIPKEIITNITVPTSNVYRIGDDLTFSIQFNDVVTLDTSFGTPTIPLMVGSDTIEAIYISGSGTNELIFSYTIVNTDNDGIVHFASNNGIGSINLNGGKILYLGNISLQEQNLNFPPSTAITNVTVDTPAIVNTQNINAYIDASGIASITPEQVNNGSTDINASGSFTLSLDISTFNCSNLGNNTVILTITDSGGNISQNSAIVNIDINNDGSTINVITQDITIPLNEATLVATITPNDINNGSSAVCGIQSMSISQDTFNCDDAGQTITVTLTITNISGHSATALANVTITDSGNNCQKTFVPDDNFENYLETHDANGNPVAIGDATSMGNGIANDNYVANSQIENVISLFVSNINITSLEGIENFSALQTLECNSNQIPSLNLLNLNNLTDVNANNNVLTDIILPSSNNLINLYVSDNLLTNLNISPYTELTILECSGNMINSLDLTSNTNLEVIEVADNNISNLDLTTNTLLESLDCDNNNLTTLNISANTILTELSCNSNSLSTLNISNNSLLTAVFAEENMLTNIDITQNTALEIATFGDNQLTSINTSANTNLIGILLSNNQLSSINLSSNTALQFLVLNSNPLTSLNLDNNNDLTYFECSNNINLTELSFKITDYTDITDFIVINNPMLNCIEVISASYSTTNWTTIDAQTSFNTDCSSTLSAPSFQQDVITIYPNPTDSYITISGLTQTENAEIYTLNGQKILETEINNTTNTINVIHISSGTYFLKIKDTTLKFIKN